jgi:ubiquinone/menaquinone biosynthesis C-methylase UbiE
MHEFVKTCEGTILDVGCDDVNISSTIFSNKCSYIGLDPFSTSTSFRVVGVGEILPFKDSSIDNVVFNTSLDHILDYYEAVKEAFRVLKPEGYIIICTLIWLQNTSILHDSVHFHHFKDYEINGVLRDFNFKIENTKRYTYKNDTHRYGLYISAKKP